MPQPVHSIAAICIGASAGATLRWLASSWLNPLFSGLPLGTLAVNLAGGYLMGLALAFFSLRADLAPWWPLLVITGFLGALTTFSAFSAEVAMMIREGRLMWACLTIGAHVVGSLVMTFLGLATVSLTQRLS